MKLLPNPSSYNSMQADANFDNYYTNGNNDLDNHHQNAKDVDICSK
jgi:hypothetical protein